MGIKIGGNNLFVVAILIMFAWIVGLGSIFTRNPLLIFFGILALIIIFMRR